MSAASRRLGLSRNRNVPESRRVAVTVERAQIDRVCGLSKQIIVTKKQGCGGLALVQDWGR
jgi:hypothetical protein